MKKYFRELSVVGALVVVLAGVLGAIIWNILTWYWGLPTSSSHALIGGLVGAGLAAAATLAGIWFARHDEVARYCKAEAGMEFQQEIS